MSDDDEPVRHASLGDGEIVASILSDGFEHDPVINWVLDGGEQMPTFFASLIADPVLAAGGTYLGHDCCAVWTRPGRDPWRGSDLATRFTATMRTTLSASAFDRLKALNSATERAQPTQPHWYLGMFATRQRSQGQGLGSAMLRHTLTKVDEEQQGAYLEATEPSNVPFYDRFGFTVRNAITMPSGPTIALMWRDRRT